MLTLVEVSERVGLPHHEWSPISSPGHRLHAARQVGGCPAMVVAPPTPEENRAALFGTMDHSGSAHKYERSTRAAQA
jgi:hypothetical protein